MHSHSREQSLTYDNRLAQGCWRQHRSFANHCPYTVVVCSLELACSTAWRSSWGSLLLSMCWLTPSSSGVLTSCFLVQMTKLQCLLPHCTTAFPHIEQTYEIVNVGLVLTCKISSSLCFKPLHACFHVFILLPFPDFWE